MPIEASVVTIDVDEEPDILARITLLNSAFFRIMSGSRLIRVLRADYKIGHLEAVIESPPVEPRVNGRVSVSFKRLPLGLGDHARRLAPSPTLSGGC